MTLDKILCAIDFSQTSKQALRVATGLAKQTGAELVIAHVWYVPALSYGEVASFPDALEQQMKDDADAELAAALHEVKEAGVDASSRLLHGSPWREVVDLLDADRAFDLVVLGTNGRGALARIALGSVADQVVRHAPCSVLVVPATTRIAPFRTILCPVDFQEASTHAVELAASLVAPDGELALLHVLDLPAGFAGEPTAAGFVSDLDQRGAELLASLAQTTRARTTATVTTRTRIGTPGRQTLAVLDAEPDFDLVALGTHGRTGVRRMLLGSVAEKIVRHAPCPILVARMRS